MATPRSAWGIDIGNRGLKAVKLIRAADDFKIDDVDFIEHETVLSQAGDNREALINTALATFVSRRNVKGSVVSVGVAGGSSFARFIKLPPVEDKRLPEIVRFEAIQQIPFPLDEVEWSYQLFRQPENPEVEVGIFAMRKDLVNAFVKYFTDVDLNVQVVQMNPLAVYNAMQRDGRLADGVSMILDVGADNTDLLIASDNSVWHRSIPIGGNTFTETLMKAFKVPFVKAEELKRTAATSKYQRQIFSAMRPVFADLVAEVQRSIGFYGSTNREQTISRLYAIGGTMKLTPLQKYLSQNLQMDVVKIDAFNAQPPTDGKASGDLLEHMPSLHAAYGLALQAMDSAKITSSLLPTAIRREKMWKEKTKWFAAAAGIAACAAMVPVGRLFIDKTAFAANTAEREQVAQIARQATELKNKWGEIENAGSAELAAVKNVMSLVNNRAVWSDILVDLTNAVPKPPAALANALASRDAAALKAVPRDQRPVFRIESVQSRYLTDVGRILRDTGSILRYAPELGGNPVQPGARDRFNPTMSGFTPPNMGEEYVGPPASVQGQVQSAADASGQPAQRGFLVKVRLISPQRNADTTLIRQLVPAINAVAPNANTPVRLYAFQKAEIVRSLPLSQDPELMRRLVAEHAASQATDLAPSIGLNPVGINPNSSNPLGVRPPPSLTNPRTFGGQEGQLMGEEFGGMTSPSGVPNGTDPDAAGAEVDPEDRELAPFKDRLTGEDVRNDQVVDVMFVIVLDPPPYTPPPEDPNAAPSQ